MSPELFLRQFGELAEAPAGIDELRKLTISLAISGRLTLITDRRIRNSNSVPYWTGESATANLSGQLPLGWSWKAVHELGTIAPKNIAANEMTAGFVPMTNVPVDFRTSIRIVPRPWGELKKGYTHLADGDVAVAKITPCFQNRKSCVVAGLPNGIGAGTTELHVVRPNAEIVLPQYLLLCFKAPAFIERGIPTMTGTAGQKRIPSEYFSQYRVPIPPLHDQHAAVHKAGQLMALCDELEAKQKKKREAGTRFTKASLQALTAARAPEEVNAAWKRMVQNWAVVIDNREKVSELRLAAVDLASRGRLVRQEPRDAPSELALRIRREERKAAWEDQERKKAIRQGRPQRGDKWRDAYVVPKFEVPEVLPALPKSWSYEAIGLLGADHFAPVQTGPFGAQLHSSEFVSSGVPVIAVGNLTGTGFTKERLYFITQEKAVQLARYDVEAGDLLFARSGATLGKVCVAPDFVRNWRMTGHILRVRLDPRIIDADLAALWLWAAGAVKEQVISSIRGGTRPGYNTSLLENIVLPIPPRAEQVRILDRIGVIMKLCDQLEVAFQCSENLASELVEAVVQELVA